MSQRASDTSLPRTKKGCTPSIWAIAAKAEAERTGLDPIKLLAGYKAREFVDARWNVWRALADAGFSYFSIGQASGFDHSTVQHGCKLSMRQASTARHEARFLRLKSEAGAAP
jgi:hypothetical protein